MIGGDRQQLSCDWSGRGAGRQRAAGGRGAVLSAGGGGHGAAARGETQLDAALRPAAALGTRSDADIAYRYRHCRCLHIGIFALFGGRKATGLTPVPVAGPAIIQVDICAEELHNSAPAAVALQVSSDWWRAGHVTSVPPPIGQDPAQLRDGEPALPGPHLEAGPRPAGAEARQAVQGRPGRAAEEVRNIRNNAYENINNE